MWETQLMEKATALTLVFPSLTTRRASLFGRKSYMFFKYSIARMLFEFPEIFQIHGAYVCFQTSTGKYSSTSLFLLEHGALSVHTRYLYVKVLCVVCSLWFSWNSINYITPVAGIKRALTGNICSVCDLLMQGYWKRWEEEVTQICVFDGGNALKSCSCHSSYFLVNRCVRIIILN